MHQNNAMGLLAGFPHYIAVNGVRTGVAAHGVLGADVPVHPLPAFLSHFGFQLLHQPFAAVAAAHRVGAAARESQITDALCVHIGRDALLQQGDIRPVGFAAAVDVAVFVGGRVQRDLVPGGSGLRLLEELKRRRSRAAVIIISARDSLDDKIEGLELGADDYLPKPFHLAELSARIRSVLRRHRHDGRQSLDAGNVRLWPDSRRVEVAGREVELLRKEYDILHYFMSRPNHTVDKTALAEGVWGDHIDQADNFDFVYAQMKNLRRKLHDAGADIEIRAVYGFGYKLVQP